MRPGVGFQVEHKLRGLGLTSLEEDLLVRPSVWVLEARVRATLRELERAHGEGLMWGFLYALRGPGETRVGPVIQVDENGMWSLTGLFVERVDPGRVQRGMQLLGLLTYSRVEEWREVVRRDAIRAIEEILA